MLALVVGAPHRRVCVFCLYVLCVCVHRAWYCVHYYVSVWLQHYDITAWLPHCTYCYLLWDWSMLQRQKVYMYLISLYFLFFDRIVFNVRIRSCKYIRNLICFSGFITVLSVHVNYFSLVLWVVSMPHYICFSLTPVLYVCVYVCVCAIEFNVTMVISFNCSSFCRELDHKLPLII